ncbi:hypothetical protein PIL02S_02002 [Paenibacillus illinoisensis]|uniref:Uncharacterized protein n=1 Tax=Paenibacillus illinoisensis TaxID=59845 RepID=A0A2W0CC98_9BACL|nr:hypothetical protein PIL02S_02002 [Paenibacillus illinoisensis]
MRWVYSKDYVIYYNSLDDETKIAHEILSDHLNGKYNNGKYIYKVRYEVHTGQEENLEKSFTISDGYELNTDESSVRFVLSTY